MVLFSGIAAGAQSGEYLSYAPYSIYGIGNLTAPGSPYNRSMGGVGIASRNVRYINTLNPAAVTARDTLSVMMEFSVGNDNTIFSQKLGTGAVAHSARNITNIGSMAMSFPIWRHMAMMLGAAPYSSGGYEYSFKETDPSVIAKNGNISYSSYGQGALYRIFGGVGYRFGKNLSVGAEADYIFGNFEKDFTETFSKTGYTAALDKYTATVHGFTGKFGLQYEQKVSGTLKLGAGATYTMGTALGGRVETVSATTTTDTLGLGRTYSPQLAGELGLGLSVNYSDKIRAEINYVRADWSRSGFDSTPGFSIASSPLPFSASVRQGIRAGAEYIPDRYNIRHYYKRIAYRAGAYYNNEYFKVAGNEINSFGITLGATIPIPNQYNLYQGLSVSLDLGQRGTVANSLVRERYARITVGVNLHDIWFRKMRYE